METLHVIKILAFSVLGVIIIFLCRFTLRFGSSNEREDRFKNKNPMLHLNIRLHAGRGQHAHEVHVKGLVCVRCPGGQWEDWKLKTGHSRCVVSPVRAFVHIF